MNSTSYSSLKFIQNKVIFMNNTKEFSQSLNEKERKLNRYQFMKLSLEEPAEKLLKHYEENIEYSDS